MIFRCFSFLLVFFPLAGWGADFHAIIVCDTHAEGIERSVHEDCRNICEEIKKICRYTKLKPCIKKFTGYEVCSEVLDTIHAIQAGPDDVVLFYWSGHGTRFPSQTDPWPVFDFEHDYSAITQYTITEVLMKKNPRFILSFSDCCNNFAQGLLSRLSKGKKKQVKENYERLFLDFRGTYIAAAASPGEFAFGLNSPHKEFGLASGGLFTNAFLEALQEETMQLNPYISWEVIFELAVNKSIEYQLRNIYDPNVYQHPFYQYIRH